MNHLVFLVNPNSGVERNKSVQATIETTLDKTQFTYEIQETLHEKHGITLARQAAEKRAYAVIAIGGDGSVNDVIKGLENTDTVLGIIPKGSGNGMARSLKIPLSVEGAIKIINQNKVESVDVAYANEHAFLSNAGVGFDALVIQRFRNNKRRGFLSYCSIINNCIWKYPAQEYTITTDGKELKEKAFMINVANGRELGYSFVIAPDANWKDGLLDVTVIKSFPKLFAALLALRMLNKSIHKSRYTKTFKAKEVIITSPSLNLMQTDGDTHATASKILFIVKGSQRIFVP